MLGRHVVGRLRTGSVESRLSFVLDASEGKGRIKENGSSPCRISRQKIHVGRRRWRDVSSREAPVLL